MANKKVQKTPTTKKVETPVNEPQEQLTATVEAVAETVETTPVVETTSKNQKVAKKKAPVKNQKVEESSEKKVTVAESQSGGDKKTIVSKTNTLSKNKSQQEPPQNESRKKKRDPNRNYRFFRAIDDIENKSDGRYTGDTPKQAASKRFTKFLQKTKSEGKPIPKKSVNIYIRESTRNSAGKVYGYSALKVALDEPQILEIKDANGLTKEIVYKYRNKLKKIAVPDDVLQKYKKVKKLTDKKKKLASGSKSLKKLTGAKTGKPNKIKKPTQQKVTKAQASK